MKRLGASLLFFLFFPGLACAAGAASADIVESSVCDVLANPLSFDGKVIRIKNATVVAGFDEFLIEGSGCNPPAAIWLDYPEATKGKAGPVAFTRLQAARNSALPSVGQKRAAVTLQRNGDFERFDTLLSTPYKSSAACLGCMRYTVTATLVGRLDGTDVAGVVRDKDGKPTRLAGFGNLNLYRARLVLQSVSDVVPQEVTYPGSARAARGDSRRVQQADPELLKKAADAFGGPGEANGVDIGFHLVNEVPPDEGLKGSVDSPDGLLFNVSFDMDRLGKTMLQRAIAHMGAHIADVRSGLALGGIDDFEARAWRVTFVK